MSHLGADSQLLSRRRARSRGPVDRKPDPKLVEKVQNWNVSTGASTHNLLEASTVFQPEYRDPSDFSGWRQQAAVETGRQRTRLNAKSARGGPRTEESESESGEEDNSPTDVIIIRADPKPSDLDDLGTLSLRRRRDRRHSHGNGGPLAPQPIVRPSSRLGKPSGPDFGVQSETHLAVRSGPGRPKSAQGLTRPRSRADPDRVPFDTALDINMHSRSPARIHRIAPPDLDVRNDVPEDAALEEFASLLPGWNIPTSDLAAYREIPPLGGARSITELRPSLVMSYFLTLWKTVTCVTAMNEEVRLADDIFIPTERRMRACLEEIAAADPDRRTELQLQLAEHLCYAVRRVGNSALLEDLGYWFSVLVKRSSGNEEADRDGKGDQQDTNHDDTFLTVYYPFESCRDARKGIITTLRLVLLDHATFEIDKPFGHSSTSKKVIGDFDSARHWMLLKKGMPNELSKLKVEPGMEDLSFFFRTVELAAELEKFDPTRFFPLFQIPDPAFQVPSKNLLHAVLSFGLLRHIDQFSRTRR